MGMMISDVDIDRHALDVVRKLKEAGFEAYLVGGCVRDLLLKLKPKDFDVATNALPAEIKKVFNKHCHLIGRRFRLAHVYFGHERKIIEVATFRSPPSNESEETKNASGLLVRDNVYGSLEEDVWRRDFTINAFYYDPDENRLVDRVEGMADLQNKLLRIIGDPEERFREDPVRMLRAIRFAAKLGFTLETNTAKPIRTLAPLLSPISHARLFEEVLKLFHGGASVATYHLLVAYDLFGKLFPQTEKLLETPIREQMEKLLLYTFESTDTRILAGKTITPAFLYTALLWRPLKETLTECLASESKLFAALEIAMTHVLRIQQQTTAVPRYLTQAIREIWHLQFHLEQRRGKKPLALLQQPRFRAAYDLLVLRARSGEIDMALTDWWTTFQEASADEKLEMLKQKKNIDSVSRRRKKRKVKKKKPPQESA